MRPVPIALGILFMAGLLLVIPGNPRAQEAGSSTGEITEPVQRGIERGLEYLVGLQDPSGAFGSKYKVASTSLACLAIMANGQQNGPWENYGLFVNRGGRYLYFTLSLDGGHITQRTPDNAVAPDEWLHASATWDGSSA